MMQTRWEGTEERWTSAFVNADGVTDLEISGEGTIDGSGEEWLQKNPYRPAARPLPELLQSLLWPLRLRLRRPESPRPSPPDRHPELQGRPHRRSESAQPGGLVPVHFVQRGCCGRTSASPREHNIPSSDGIDIDSSRRVRINNVYIDVNDDCISIKSRKGRRRPARQPSGGRHRHRELPLCLRSWRRGDGQRDLRRHPQRRGAELRDADSGNWAPIRFKRSPAAAAWWRTSPIATSKLHETRQAFEFKLEVAHGAAPIAPPAKVLPVVRNVKIINVSGDAQSVGVIHGLADSPDPGHYISELQDRRQHRPQDLSRAQP